MGLPAEGLARVPVFVHDVKFDGTVRVLMARLSREDPGYGAIVLSFPDPPYISLDVGSGGGLEVNRVPWLRKVGLGRDPELDQRRDALAAEDAHPGGETRDGEGRRAGERADGRRAERAC